MELKKTLFLFLPFIIFIVSVISIDVTALKIDVGSPPILTSAIAIDEYSILITWDQPLDITGIDGFLIYRDDVLIAKEPVGSGKFYDLSLPPNTTHTYYLTSFGIFGESIKSNSLSLSTSGKNFPEPPKIIALKSDGTMVTVVWEEPVDKDKITSYEIERRIFEKEGFTSVTILSVGIIDYTDSNLIESTIYTYRISSINDVGNGKPSNEMSISSFVDPILIDLSGKLIEPNKSNSFSQGESEIIAQTIELFNVNTSSMDLIIDDIESNKLNTYEIILKMNDGSYDNTQEMKNAGAFYGTVYLESNDISIFINNVVDKVLTAVNGEKT